MRAESGVKSLCEKLLFHSRRLVKRMWEIALDSKAARRRAGSSCLRNQSFVNRFEVVVVQMGDFLAVECPHLLEDSEIVAHRALIDRLYEEGDQASGF